MAVAAESMTVDQFLSLPEEKPALELIQGAITQKVSPQGKHSSIQADFVECVNAHSRSRRLARAFPELRTTFSGESRVPDVSVYLWDRIPRDATGEIANRFELPPDIALEVVSPDQGVNLLTRRCLWFVEHGVQIALLADPVDKSVMSFRAGAAIRPLVGEDRIDLSPVLPDFALTARQLFEALR